MPLLIIVLLAQLPTTRAIQSQIVEERGLTVCELSVRASHILHGRVISIGSVIQISDGVRTIGGLYTPVQFEVLDASLGAKPIAPITLLFAGEVVSGRSQSGAVVDPLISSGEGVAFVTEQGGLFFVHGGGGWFWKASNSLTNGMVVRGSPAKQATLSVLRDEINASLEGTGGCSRPAASKFYGQPPLSTWPAPKASAP